MRLYDAHNHLHDARLAPDAQAVADELRHIGLRRAVVNGTREEDWEAVERYCAEHAWAQPSFGLHPWHVTEREEGWLERLEALLSRHPQAAVGEIGLDRWIEPRDLPTQMEVFSAQLALAVALDRPATIHCLRAWGALWDHLRAHPVPERAFLLHSYGGPAEMVPGFVKLGAYFSFSAYFLHPRKAGAREVFRQVPLERLLVETDAPDMAPPAELDRYGLADGVSGVRLNHPGHLTLAYESLAELRGIPPGELRGLVEENFIRLFGE